ncbi:hypothetical protein [Endozoicomonas sp. ONNA1]|uniref:hypothetical protein n=1 Tax=Endozoicomonas sp. ONNA1 TaxID=2828740 RepID=UPI0021480125|nr:hypothetical protein [Endozoicomonas sp. ONNA1]
MSLTLFPDHLPYWLWSLLALWLFSIGATIHPTSKVIAYVLIIAAFLTLGLDKQWSSQLFQKLPFNELTQSITVTFERLDDTADTDEISEPNGRDFNDN